MTSKQQVTNDDIMAMLSQFSDSVDRRFDAVDKRFDTMDKRFDAMDKRFDDLTSDVRILQTDMRGVKSSISSLDDRVQMLEADVREIYLMLAKRDKGDAKFSKLSLEKKLLTLNTNLLATAKEAGIALPR